MEIRDLRHDEREAWRRLRKLLWPDLSREELTREQEEILAHPEQSRVLVASAAEGLVGFLEVALRDWAEGCATRPVGYIEGWYVTPERRRLGVGRALVEAAERWARSRGCTEMGSDAELANATSHAAHRALGYGQVLRLVLFAKKLGP